MSYNNKYMELTNMKMRVHKSLHARERAGINKREHGGEVRGLRFWGQLAAP